MKQLIKALPERKRRTFMRFMNGKKKKKIAEEDIEEGEEPPVVSAYQKPTRDQLLSKIEQLKIKDDDDFYEDVISDEEEDDDENWLSDNSDENEEK